MRKKISLKDFGVANLDETKDKYSLRSSDLLEISNFTFKNKETEHEIKARLHKEKVSFYFFVMLISLDIIAFAVLFAMLYILPEQKETTKNIIAILTSGSMGFFASLGISALKKI